MADYLCRPSTAPPGPELEEREDCVYEVTDTGDSSMKVVVRVRPESEAELRSSCQCVVKVLDEHVLVFDPAGNRADGEAKKPFGAFSSPTMNRFFGGRRLRPLLSKKQKDLRFAFDHVFDETSSQSEVFHNTSHDLIEAVLDGINCSIFAYGATGAGKTHTMLGHQEDPGVIFQTMMELYRRIDALKSSKTCRVSVSYSEVYNETIRDLLVPSGPLNLREDAQKGLVVSGLSCHAPQTAEDILGMLERGNRNRTQHPTEANATSSRSHAVFQVFVEQQARTAGISAEVTQAKLSLIDLAGSERATVTSNKGARFREGANINRSLLALGNCINALASTKGKTGYVPYRDSKLTRLLKDSLGGNCRTVMVANISPSALSYEDTYNTLKYADRAKQIKTKLVRNVLQVDYHLTKYRAIVQELRREISELKVQVDQTSPRQESFDSKEADRLCELVSSVYGERGRLRKHMADLDAKEREALLKVCRKERDLHRIDMLSANEVKKVKMTARLDALRRHVLEIQRQKQTVNEYLYSNNESVGRVQGVVNAACRAETGGGALQRLLEAVAEAKKLEVENSHQWKQTKNLLKYIKNQERESVKTERMLSMALSLVQRQQCLLKAANVDTGSIQDNLDSLTHLADGDKGVAWADQTRISTNDLQDVSVSTLSLTQQQLFDCFLEHSSPRNRGLRRNGVYSPQLFPTSLSILTATGPGRGNTSRGQGEESDRTITPTHSSTSSLDGCGQTTPLSRTGSGGTVTVRASHTISSRASPHGSVDSLNGGGSVTVTTDVCISSSPGSECDSLSEVSSSGVGSYGTSSAPSSSPHCEVDYDKLEKKCVRVTTPTGRMERKKPILDISPRVGYGGVPLGNYASTRTLNRAGVGMVTPGPAPQPYSMFQPFHPLPSGRSLSTSHIPSSPSRHARSLSTSHMATPTSRMATPTSTSSGRSLSVSHMATPLALSHPTTPHSSHASLSSVHSISTDSGIGQVTALSRATAPPPGPAFTPLHAPNRTRGPLVIPNRPLANGFMVRSSPSGASGFYGNNHYYPTKMEGGVNGFEDNFVSPPHVNTSQRLPGDRKSPYVQHQIPRGPISKSGDNHMMKVPIGAIKSHLGSPFAARVTATPNPYVKDPSHLPHPPATPTTSTGRPPHVYQSITIPGPPPSHPPPTSLPPSAPSSTAVRTGGGRKGSNTSCDSVWGSKSSLPEEDEQREDKQDHALNSTFTVEQSAQQTTAAATGTEKRGGASGRGIFRNRSPSRLPRYLKMTKSAESKKVNRVNKENQQNKENQTQAPANSGLRFKRFNLNRSRDRINVPPPTSRPGTIALSSKYNSAPQLAW